MVKDVFFILPIAHCLFCFQLSAFNFERNIALSFQPSASLGFELYQITYISSVYDMGRSESAGKAGME
jgi:hypothetical protein